MCDPATLAAVSFGISAVQGVAGYFGKRAAYNANAANAVAGTEAQWASQQLRIQQEGAAATQDKFETNIAVAKAAATATTAAGEGGVSGLSVDYLLKDLYAAKGRHNAAVSQNLQMTTAYLQSEKEVTRAQGIDRINSVEKPNFGATLLGIFGSGINAYGSYKSQVA